MTSTKTKPDARKQLPFEFFIRRAFDAPRARVWKAWTDAKSLGQWWGPKGFDIASVKLDLRPGGMFHYLLRSPDGQEMWGKLIFREIVPRHGSFLSSPSPMRRAGSAGTRYTKAGRSPFYRR